MPKHKFLISSHSVDNHIGTVAEHSHIGEHSQSNELKLSNGSIADADRLHSMGPGAWNEGFTPVPPTASSSAFGLGGEVGVVGNYEISPNHSYSSLDTSTLSSFFFPEEAPSVNSRRLVRCVLELRYSDGDCTSCTIPTDAAIELYRSFA